MAAEVVFPIATDFLTIQEETVLLQLQTNSASAYVYLDKIPMEQWKLPPW